MKHCKTCICVALLLRVESEVLKKREGNREATRISGPQPQASCTMNSSCRSPDRLAWLWDSGTVIGDGLHGTCPSLISILLRNCRQITFSKIQLSQTETEVSRYWLCSLMKTPDTHYPTEDGGVIEGDILLLPLEFSSISFQGWPFSFLLLKKPHGLEADSRFANSRCTA